MGQPNLQQFYIAEEQSIYLLNHHDAEKLRNWIALCHQQLVLLGYQKTEFIGKGAYGFAFAGTSPSGKEHVFKFSRITLPENVQDRLEEEGFMLDQIDDPLVPACLGFYRIGKQRILAMQRAAGEDLEQLSLRMGPLPADILLNIAAQMVEILNKLRQLPRPIIHGDIKPSNIVYDHHSSQIGLVDWGSSVFAQLDAGGQFITTSVMELMSGDLQNSNARLGDVYFIGEEQLSGALSSPRFDEQGLAGTLYALASGQSCRFGNQVLPVTALGLPREFALTLQNMLSPDPLLRRRAGDYLLSNMKYMKNIVVSSPADVPLTPQLPIWSAASDREIESVVYTSRKSFLREEAYSGLLDDIDDVQLDNYYKNFLQGMGDNEKAFLAAVSRLGKFPVVGGLAINWQPDGIYIDSNVNLFDEQYRHAFTSAVNNMVTLARAIDRVGIFKSCFFDAKATLHIERENSDQLYIPEPGTQIRFEVSPRPQIDDESRLHSYFEDAKDPDEQLVLPDEIMELLAQMNLIHHTGCIIFEALETDLKIHNYLTLLDPDHADEFRTLLDQILAKVSLIRGQGVSGFMKFPYKDTKKFSRQQRLADCFQQPNPKQTEAVTV